PFGKTTVGGPANANPYRGGGASRRRASSTVTRPASKSSASFTAASLALVFLSVDVHPPGQQVGGQLFGGTAWCRSARRRVVAVGDRRRCQWRQRMRRLASHFAY